MKRRAFVLGGVLSVTTALFGLALASEGARAQARRKITLEDELVIEGTVQKPEAMFILPRQNLNFSELERREDLKSRILKSVEREPF